MNARACGLILILALCASVAVAQVPDEYFTNINVSGTATVGTLDPTNPIADGDVASTIARDSEVSSAVSTHASDNDAHQALVTLTGTPDYITLSGQAIARGKVDLTAAADVTGTLPDANIVSTIARDTELHNAVTLSGTPDYITIGGTGGQVITRGAIDLANDVTGALPLSALSTTGADDGEVIMRSGASTAWGSASAALLAAANDWTNVNTYLGTTTGATAPSWARVVVEHEGAPNTETGIAILTEVDAAGAAYGTVSVGDTTDPDSGMLRYKRLTLGNAWAFWVGGTERAVLDQDGGWQIDGNLNVDGTGAQTIEGYIDQNGATANTFAGAIQCASTDDSAVMGQFGIGTTTPAKDLDIVSDATIYVGAASSAQSVYVSADRGSTGKGASYRLYTDGSESGFFGHPFGSNDSDVEIGCASATIAITIPAGTDDVTLADDLSVGGYLRLGSATAPSYGIHMVGDGTVNTIYSDSTASVTWVMDRAASGNSCSLSFKTGGAATASIGLAGSSSDLTINAGGGTAITIPAGTDDVTVSGDLQVDGGGNFTGALTAASYADNTPGWDKSNAEALSALSPVKSATDSKTGKSEIDHATLPDFARATWTEWEDLDGNPSTAAVAVVHEGRDLGAMITLQTHAIQALETENADLRYRMSQAENALTILAARVAALENPIAEATK